MKYSLLVTIDDVPIRELVPSFMEYRNISSNFFVGSSYNYIGSGLFEKAFLFIK